ncbi:MULTISPECIES: SdpI family protein [unclassified Corynebacterium]|uniref:SdpI family protein n=1 Tax=unclassified Corynebacterium TaxID=2624378 RepID=UPI002A90B3D2|nr:SdpI family protein [Corynebacterium sp.]MDY5785705.1 SdpI family protein [Corynebacterium sp.]
MSAVNLVVGVIFFVLAVALVVAGALAIARRFPGNSAFGLRVPEVRADKAVWEQAHVVAGPFWVFAGVALAFGGAFALRASGWMWVLPVIMFLAAVVAISVAGNFGARAAALVDASRNEQDEDLPEGAVSLPLVDLDAVRRAAGRADDAR